MESSQSRMGGRNMIVTLKGRTAFSGHSLEPTASWSDCVRQLRRARAARPAQATIGVLEGEGVGPEVIGCALNVLAAVESVSRTRFKIAIGGPIGKAAERAGGKTLPEDVVDFCRDIFARGGAVLNGPGGGRYVYELRKQFDL